MDVSQNSNLLNIAKRNMILSVILIIFAAVKIALPFFVSANSENFLYDLYMLEHKISPLIGTFSVLLVISSFSLYRKIKLLFSSDNN